MANKHHKNTLLRIKRVREIVDLHYEEGNLAKCYKMVWKRYVYPIYPMCYRTFLSYLNIPEDEVDVEDKRWPTLFD